MGFGLMGFRGLEFVGFRAFLQAVGVWGLKASRLELLQNPKPTPNPKP